MTAWPGNHGIRGYSCVPATTPWSGTCSPPTRMISVPPLKAVRAGQPNGLLPSGLGAYAGQPVYRFARPPTAMAFQKFRRTADEMYARELDGTPMLDGTDGAALEALAPPEEGV